MIVLSLVGLIVKRLLLLLMRIHQLLRVLIMTTTIAFASLVSRVTSVLQIDRRPRVRIHMTVGVPAYSYTHSSAYITWAQLRYSVELPRQCSACTATSDISPRTQSNDE